ncbi:hypothetical protein [Streptomyces sp. NPDC001530]|uniref:hypothetical protein n=1 Tax=Streptomyces sp. NPDC001530 TaxID=3364582 RepID=UPI0036835435
MATESNGTTAATRTPTEPRPDGRVDPDCTRLIVIRGNSASGKSSVARALRDTYGRGLAWVEQDHVRRILLRERDRPGAANIGLIEQSTRYALGHGFHTVLEGILHAKHYGAMLARLHRDFAPRAHFYL